VRFFSLLLFLFPLSLCLPITIAAASLTVPSFPSAELRPSLTPHGEEAVSDSGSLAVRLSFSFSFFSLHEADLFPAIDLCELQAGRIEVASTVGKGSIFRCFITARSVDAGLPEGHHKPVAVIEGITAPNAERGAAPTVYLARPGEKKEGLSGLTILCCEVRSFFLSFPFAAISLAVF
jgi:hypothetical protein